MRAVVLVVAVPGFEDAVEASLLRLPFVRDVRVHRSQRFRLAATIEGEGPNEIRNMMISQVRLISGVRGLGIAREPTIG